METLSRGSQGLCRFPIVLAQQATQHIPSPDRTIPGTLVTRHQCPLLQALMRPHCVGVYHGDGEHPAEVCLAENEQVIEALLAYGADPALGGRGFSPGIPFSRPLPARPSSSRIRACNSAIRASRSSRLAVARSIVLPRLPLCLPRHFFAPPQTRPLNSELLRSVRRASTQPPTGMRD